MLQSIYAGVSSLQSFQTGIDVLSNNIANVNTVGFKGSSTEFSDLFNKKMSTSGDAVTSMESGLGVQVSTTALDISKGSFYQTNKSTDLAIVGDDGWFGLVGPNQNQYFTRAGNFNFNPYSENGTLENVRLTSEEGYFVTGTSANNTTGGVLNPIVERSALDLTTVTTQEALIFPSELDYPVQATSQANFFGNLDLNELTHVIISEVISPNDERNSLRLEFTQSAIQPLAGINWDILATAQSIDGATTYDTQTGLIRFDQTGTLIDSQLSSINNDGAPVTASFTNGLVGITSTDRVFTGAGIPDDGVLSGKLVDYTINNDGEIISSFTNGQYSVVGKVAIYHFQNDQGLEAVSGNKFRASNNSGEPIFYTQNNGQLLSGTLENSNVNLNTALTELIIMQRSYDAASKTITTGDDLLKNALQMDA